MWNTHTEFQEGGPLRLVENGDVITIDIQKRRMDVDLTDEELNKRRQRWTQPAYKADRGVLYKVCHMCNNWFKSLIQSFVLFWIAWISNHSTSIASQSFQIYFFLSIFPFQIQPWVLSISSTLFSLFRFQYIKNVQSGIEGLCDGWVEEVNFSANPIFLWPKDVADEKIIIKPYACLRRKVDVMSIFDPSLYNIIGFWFSCYWNFLGWCMVKSLSCFLFLQHTYWVASAILLLFFRFMRIYDKFLCDFASLIWWRMWYLRWIFIQLHHPNFFLRSIFSNWKW